jgi:UDP-N-acetyl-2-amino-2-deoxyglucuronate dehydrogenase
VRWFLSVNAEHLPAAAKARGQRTYRSITVDGSEVEFSDGFTDLHTESYRHILGGGGFGLAEARTAVAMVQAIRTGEIVAAADAAHPLSRLAA